MLRAKLGLISMAIRKPMKCNRTPKATKTKAEAQMAISTFLAVMEMVRTEAVGPDTHINCINCSEKLIRQVVKFFTTQTRIVGSYPPKSHLIFYDQAQAMTKNTCLKKVNPIDVSLKPNTNAN
jgi:hypothetical protein